LRDLPHLFGVAGTGRWDIGGRRKTWTEGGLAPMRGRAGDMPINPLPGPFPCQRPREPAGRWRLRTRAHAICSVGRSKEDALHRGNGTRTRADSLPARNWRRRSRRRTRAGRLTDCRRLHRGSTFALASGHYRPAAAVRVDLRKKRRPSCRATQRNVRLDAFGQRERRRFGSVNPRFWAAPLGPPSCRQGNRSEEPPSMVIGRGRWRMSASWTVFFGAERPRSGGARGDRAGSANRFGFVERIDGRRRLFTAPRRRARREIPSSPAATKGRGSALSGQGRSAKFLRSH